MLSLLNFYYDCYNHYVIVVHTCMNLHEYKRLQPAAN